MRPGEYKSENIGKQLVIDMKLTVAVNTPVKSGGLRIQIYMAKDDGPGNSLEAFCCVGWRIAVL